MSALMTEKGGALLFTPTPVPKTSFAALDGKRQEKKKQHSLVFTELEDKKENRHPYSSLFIMVLFSHQVV